MAVAAECQMGANRQTDSTDSSAKLSLQGFWKEKCCNMGFEIKDNQFIEYVDVIKKTITFAGDIVNKPDLFKEHGLIVVKLIDPGTSNGRPGQYAVVRWKNFKGNQVGQTYAKDDKNQPIFFETQAQAEALIESAPELDRFCCQVSNRQ